MINFKLYAIIFSPSIGERLHEGRRGPDVPSDVPAIAPMTPRRTPSSYSNQGLCNPAPAPWHTPVLPNRPTLGAQGSSDPSTDDLGSGQDDECPYVDLASPEMLQFRDGLRAEFRDKKSSSPTHLTVIANAQVSSGHDSPIHTPNTLSRASPPPSPRHSVTAFCCDAAHLQSTKNTVAPTPSPALTTAAVLETHDPISTRRSRCHESRKEVSSYTGRRKRKDELKSSSLGESFVQQLASLTSSSLATTTTTTTVTTSSSSSTYTSSSGSSSGGSTHRSSPQHTQVL